MSVPGGTKGGLKQVDHVHTDGEEKCKQLSKEGDGKAVVFPREPDDNYPKQGYSELTRMRVLNDAELCRNLQTLYNDHRCYSRCGATLVALNLMEKAQNLLRPPFLAMPPFSELTLSSWAGRWFVRHQKNARVHRHRKRFFALIGSQT